MKSQLNIEVATGNLNAKPSEVLVREIEVATTCY